MGYSKTFRFREEGATPEEALEEYRQSFTPHGNDLDLLTQSMMLLEAGHYRASARFAIRVQPPAGTTEEPPDDVDALAARAIFIAAAERARPLYERAALEIEGKVENSSTMANYEKMLSMLREAPSW